MRRSKVCGSGLKTRRQTAPEAARSAEEAIDLANSSSYGLGGTVFANDEAVALDDEAVALDVADRLDVGMVWINQREGGGPELPFGGTKRSASAGSSGRLASTSS
jgi:succinate-semialdehyde dehydrogenase/glutarate-semialdehyde dehydrogenase